MYEYMTNDVIFDRWQEVGALINDASADLAGLGWELVSCVPRFAGDEFNGVAHMAWRREAGS